MNERTCSVAGCDRKHRARGFCHNHYTLARKRGEFIGLPLPKPSLSERFLEKVDRDGPNGCWVWLAAMDRHGYGRFGIGVAPFLAHRVSYETFVGPIPDGLQIDHLCRNTACVNPDHLEPVTPKVNVLRSRAVTALNARKTHCINGHQFTAENTWIDVKRNGRVCRTCQAARKAAAKAAQQTTLTTRRAN